MVSSLDLFWNRTVTHNSNNYWKIQSHNLGFICASVRHLCFDTHTHKT